MQSRRVADQRAVVDQLKNVGASFASLVGGEEGKKIHQLVRENSEKYFEITNCVNEKSKNLEFAVRQTAEVRLQILLCAVLGKVFAGPNGCHAREGVQRQNIAKHWSVLAVCECSHFLNPSQNKSMK